jgi:threonine/homoserine/homoserine lactone efflux protein
LTGVIATKLAEENMIKKDLILFGIGAVISTLIIQTIIELIGSITIKFLTEDVVSILNIFVGVSLMYFAIKLLRKRETRADQ